MGLPAGRHRQARERPPGGVSRGRPALGRPGATARWNELLALREQVLVALEGLRKNKQIGSAQEAKVRITTNRPDHWLPMRQLLATLCIVSEVEIVADPAAATEPVAAERSPHAKCERCWNYRPTVGQSAEHPTLCERCVRVVGELNAVDGSAGARASATDCGSAIDPIDPVVPANAAE